MAAPVHSSTPFLATAGAVEPPFPSPQMHMLITNNVAIGSAPKTTADDRARLIVFSLSNWTLGEQIEQLMRRQLLPKSVFTEREGRAVRRELAKFLADAKAHFNPMILDGTFAEAENAYGERRGLAPIDMIIQYTHSGRYYDNRNNPSPLSPPELHRTKEPWLGYNGPPRHEYAPQEWEK